MAEIVFQEVFNRIFTYLREAGVEMTANTYRSLLQLIDDAVAETGEEGDQERLLSIAVDLIPRYFDLPSFHPPAPYPPICRASIGYRGND
ncbi:hypothetical protein MSNKSG1_07038 [Marinobacter santoriniensis NKSG1]|uniref:Uncharacterized protein n=1 Tax=Marinobacter santoriniensis NKSG1 TaxID=1288826 RepID=M7CTV2_9GAMM|nr:hypothetical protein [Marinobacter santoriniensis]EMP55605.1 hypothetical protein MSNKSG1_07038 [Marinobacter santoriniensis NKSG1]